MGIPIFNAELRRLNVPHGERATAALATQGTSASGVASHAALPQPA